MNPEELTPWSRSVALEVLQDELNSYRTDELIEMAQAVENGTGLTV